MRMSARHSPIHYKQLLGDPSSSNSSSNSKSNGGGGADSTDSYAHFSLISSVAFTVNNIAGPGMLAIPVIYQQAGWIPTSVLLVVFCVITSLASVAFCESIDILEQLVRRVPRFRFTERREFCPVVRFYFGDNWFVLCQLAFFISLQSLNIASIVVCAQSIDNLLVQVFGRVDALQIFPSLTWVTSHVGGDDVFGSHVLVVSAGYLICTIIFLPTGLWHLTESSRFQTFSFWLMLLIMLEFVWHFVERPLSFASMPPFGKEFSQLLGVMTFSYSYTTMLPSWYLEKEKAVTANETIWISSSVTTLLYMIMGILGSISYPDLRTDNVLNVMSNESGSVLTKLCVILFSLATVAPGIGVRSIMLRLNLLGNTSREPEDQGLSHEAEDKSTAAEWVTCVPGWASFWGAIFPWLVAFLFYTGKDFATFINWTSLVVNGAVCLLVPFCVYLRAFAWKHRFLLQSKVKQVREEDEEEDAEFQPLASSRGLPLGESMSIETETYPCVSPQSHVPYYLTWVLLVSVTTMLGVQICQSVKSGVPSS